MKAKILTIIAKMIGNQITGNELFKEPFEILAGQFSEKEFEEIKKFFLAGQSATERVLSRKEMIAADIPEPEVDFVTEEIRFLFRKIEITDEVLVKSKYDSMELENFLWRTYRKLKGENGDIECEKSIKQGLFSVAKVWISLEFEDPDFEKKGIVRIEIKVDEIISIMENMQKDINEIKDLNSGRKKMNGRADENFSGQSSQRRASTEQGNMAELEVSDTEEVSPDEIKICLAASAEEFREDIESLKEFIEEQNAFQKAVHLMLQYYDDEMGQNIQECKYCYMLVGENAEERIQETYELACSLDSDGMAECVGLRLFFRNLQNEKAAQADSGRKKLEDRYKEDFGRAPFYFSSINRIKLDILQVLREEVPDLGFSIKSILQFQNNAAFKRAVEKLDSLQLEYKNASGSGKSEKIIAQKSKELEEQKENVKKLEEDIWSNINLLTGKLQDKDVEDARDPREEEAIESVIESGDYMKAGNILYDPGWKKDIIDLEQSMEKKRKALRRYISSQRTLISSLKATGADNSTKDEIIAIYERITEISKKWGIEYVTLYEYAEFLFNQRKYGSGIEVGEYLRCLYEIHSASDDDRARLLKLLGNLYFFEVNRGNNYEISEKNYREALQILRFKSNRNQKLFSEIHNDLAKLFWKTNQPRKAEGLLHENIDNLKRLVETEPKVYEPILAFAYNITAILANRRNQLDEALDYHYKALEIRKHLAKKSSFYNMQTEKDLTATYNNIGIVYRKLRDFPNTDKYYKESIKIRERNAKRNRFVYEPLVALAYSEYSVFLNIKGENRKAQEYCQKAFVIRDTLARENPSYKAELSNTLYEYGIIMADAHDYDQAEKYMKEAIEIRENLIEKDEITYRLDLAEAYRSYGKILVRMGKAWANEKYYKKAEKNFVSAIKIFVEFAKDNPDYDEEKIAEAYQSYALLLEEHFQRYSDAKEYYEKAIINWKRLTRKCQQVYEPKLKEAEDYLAKLRAKMGE